MWKISLVPLFGSVVVDNGVFAVVVADAVVIDVVVGLLVLIDVVIGVVFVVGAENTIIYIDYIFSIKTEWKSRILIQYNMY